MKRLPSFFPLLSAVIAAGGCLLLVTAAQDAVTGWKAGAASVAITPSDPLWMAGYGGRKEPSDGTKLTELSAKALVLEDADGKRGLVISLDLVGIDREMSARICQQIEAAHGIKREQIAIATSHTHSGPVVGRRNLGPLHWWLLDADQQKKVDAYAEELVAKVVAVAGEAIGKLAPARVQWGSGQSTFAVNRRENLPQTDVPNLRERGILKGPIDHDVPVLSVRDPESGSIRAVLFGYACHATTLSGMQWCADYPGYAQMAIEAEHPGSVALFWAGCGADQNPLPRKEVALAQAYGAELAEAVEETLDAPMPLVAPTLTTRFQEIDAPLAEVPTVDQLEQTAATVEGYEGARARYLLNEKELGKGDDAGLDGTYPYPVGVWSLGNEVDFIWLGGEVVVDYAIRLKRERRGEQTWVAGYSNDVMAYIPSLRVLKEGGYEGGGSNVYYGLPAL
ncbi:MAG: neutral/alkaline non-lysosomal ceramidase N-terminal domain-containing protein, partial [Verrucomicrobiae bacterium]|nr:neutral/alkaline non-lysosomal ceramidase N-terminal domain-containing protein [Verrucomicrobiae bacterium]